MPTFDINLDGDNAWPELRDSDREIVHLPDAVWYLAALDGGMASGAPSLTLRFDLPPVSPGESVVLAETSLAAWISATCALRGRYPEAFAGTPLEAIEP